MHTHQAQVLNEFHIWRACILLLSSSGGVTVCFVVILHLLVRCTSRLCIYIYVCINRTQQRKYTTSQIYRADFSLVSQRLGPEPSNVGSDPFQKLNYMLLLRSVHFSASGLRQVSRPSSAQIIDAAEDHRFGSADLFATHNCGFVPQ